MKKTYFLITHSLGELDALLPILFELNSQTKLNVSIIITVKKIYNQYFKNEFYRDVLSKLNIKITFTPLLNKFDPYYLKYFNDEIFIINIFKMFYNRIYILWVKASNPPKHGAYATACSKVIRSHISPVNL